MIFCGDGQSDASQTESIPQSLTYSVVWQWNQPQIQFRQPLQESVNGNTVDAQAEHAAFMENAMRYQASLQLLDNRISGIKKAIKGEP